MPLNVPACSFKNNKNLLNDCGYYFVLIAKKSYLWPMPIILLNITQMSLIWTAGGLVTLLNLSFAV